ncbi:MAG: DUF2939 domain-containing protein [Desulfarculaceae bacterium]|nr:DUF2939 domain-containing protein [Desulfarculaceae bacterium]MCF8073413.1 DUF2939 domain-containing protein [Desulfarculaceae bacterium]MCF8100440.1 DUF2939 domain-containing protein [Desulfarculaceae bacterium]MCF8115824.1 DUF2939 domain-containing protein [Desulfarculaceae bacterium]
MRRWWALVLLVALASAAFWLTQSFLSGPRYALYQIGKAIHDREPRLFLAYVDVDSVLRGQKDLFVDMIAPQGQDEQRRSIVRGLATAFMGAAVDQARYEVAKAIKDPERQNLPSSWTLVFAANVTTNRNYALVVLSEPEKGRRLRLGMQQKGDGPWRVVSIDSRDLKALAKEFLHDRFGIKLQEQSGQQETPATPQQNNPPTEQTQTQPAQQ